MNQKKYDLHSHTYYSDGLLSPQELIDRAINMQVDALAITDHDTVAALPEAHQYIDSHALKLELINGVEITTKWHGYEIHIVGLWVDYQDPVFLDRLASQAEQRLNRAHRIADKLQRKGLPDLLPDVLKLARKDQLARPHFARVMVNKGIVDHEQAAFDKYLKKGKCAYVNTEWITIEQAVQWIQEAGGKAVIAHPGHYDMTAKWLRRLVEQFAIAGGDAMETQHPGLAPDKHRLLISLAEQHQLKYSVGSDFHRPSRWTELGRGVMLKDISKAVWCE